MNRSARFGAPCAKPRPIGPKLIASYRDLLRRKTMVAADRELGRAVFAKTCQQCHTLFGVGAKIGPDLTGSNRADLDYVLTNVLDPRR